MTWVWQPRRGWYGGRSEQANPHHSGAGSRWRRPFDFDSAALSTAQPCTRAAGAASGRCQPPTTGAGHTAPINIRDFPFDGEVNL